MSIRKCIINDLSKILFLDITQMQSEMLRSVLSFQGILGNTGQLEEKLFKTYILAGSV
jgi:hypothetical protein